MVGYLFPFQKITDMIPEVLLLTDPDNTDRIIQYQHFITLIPEKGADTGIHIPEILPAQEKYSQYRFFHRTLIEFFDMSPVPGRTDDLSSHPQGLDLDGGSPDIFPPVNKDQVPGAAVIYHYGKDQNRSDCMQFIKMPVSIISIFTVS